ncbi:hypothetical protein ACGTN6_20460, partial [Halomonas sp. THAF12]|uniref:hypothetical protein n=1 Tax=Halomonas sp. B23F22_10 TaxID=3459515 RepID=UPI00373EF8DF
PGGLVCFAGCFIGDNEYYAAMEGRTWQQMVETGDAPARHASMIRGLQRIHDRHAPEHWPRLLREEAKFYHLSDFLVDKLMTPWGN